MAGPPPLYRHTLALCGVLLEELDRGRDHEALRRRLTEGALRLVDDVVLALGDFERAERLLSADAELRTLRAHLHLAFELELVNEALFLALADQVDTIGRQLGGWLKKAGRKPDEA